MAFPAAAVGAAALVVAGTGTAHAATVSGGSVTLTVNGSWVAQLASAGVVLVPQDFSSLTANSTTQTVAVTYAATGGDANLNLGAGSVTYSGGILGFSLRGRVVSLGSLLFDLTDGQFDFASGNSGEVPLVDLGGTVDGTINGSTQTFDASDLVLDQAGADFLNNALATHVFTAGQSIGSFAASWTE
jgi:hypothetical protein